MSGARDQNTVIAHSLVWLCGNYTAIKYIWILGIAKSRSKSGGDQQGNETPIEKPFSGYEDVLSYVKKMKCDDVGSHWTLRSTSTPIPICVRRTK